MEGNNGEDTLGKSKAKKWITNFLAEEGALASNPLGNELFVEVDRDYILSKAYTKVVSICIPNIQEVILHITDANSNPEAERNPKIESDAELVYGLIHRRYIETPEGMEKMLKLYKNRVFGTCPRALCEDESLLPHGASEAPEQNSVSFYCPRCRDLYTSFKIEHLKVDGAYFGPYFPHMFEVRYPKFFDKKKKKFVGAICGFKIHRSSNVHPPKIIFDTETARNRVIPTPSVQYRTSNSIKIMPRKFAVEKSPPSNVPSS
eukprot:TRINITY_DN7045_c0_g1_i16.p1 TRINITY_DN7045_c0_g1~~TRINITY_DN7045_c0_g1_i16.p1  ORF type:complete len:261 (+),score=52.36 TRINITY_DN7045_c0_g1_i16:157-939(+)